MGRPIYMPPAMREGQEPYLRLSLTQHGPRGRTTGYLYVFRGPPANPTCHVFKGGESAYEVSYVLGCTCTGYKHHRRCKHMAVFRQAVEHREELISAYLKGGAEPLELKV